MASVSQVVGLGFGDEGKGATVDFLTRELSARLCVRFNGGAQAAHAVVTSDGVSHVFSQWGSGTLAGARSHLSRFVLVNPLGMLGEAEALAPKIGKNPFDLVTVERGCLVTTPYHAAKNRKDEDARGAARHGSCGQGIGETVAYAKRYPGDELRVEDLGDRALVSAKLSLMSLRYETETIAGLVDWYGQWSDAVKLVGPEWLSEELRRPGHVIFEGAQGVLLDERHGFMPHCTRSNCTLENADVLCRDVSRFRVTKYGVIRSYATRHGEGPLPSHDPSLDYPEAHNRDDGSQGRFRVGHFDDELFVRATDACPVDLVVVNHLDLVPFYYRYRDQSGTMQARLGGAPDFLSTLRAAFSTPVAIKGHGPTASDRRWAP